MLTRTGNPFRDSGRAITRLAAVLFIALFLLAGAALAVEISATVDRGRLNLGDTLVLTVTVTGDRQNIPQPSQPISDAFNLADVSTSSSFSFVNGRMTASQTRSYVMIPKKVGTHTIRPGSITVDGKSLAADPITVVVEQGSAAQPAASSNGQTGTGTQTASAEGVAQGGNPSATPNQDLMVECVVDRQKAFVNEQILLTFRFYRSRELYTSPEYKAPEAKNFSVEQLGDQTRTRRVINGRVYYVIEFNYALFPLFSGTQTIDPAVLTYHERVNTPANRRRSAFDDPFFDSFFNNSVMGRNLVKKSLATKPITVEVLPIPKEGRPDDFSNCIGQYKVSAVLEKDSVKANEPLAMKVMVSGFGQPSSITEPQVQLPEGFTRYDSKETSGSNVINGRIQGTKTFEYAIIPRKEGEYTIPPVSFTYFNPGTGEFQTSKTQEFRVKVLPGEKMATIPIDAATASSGREVTLLNEDIKFIKTGLKRISDKSSALYRQAWLWATLLLEIMILALGLGFRAYRDRFLSDPALVRRRGALKSFQSGLAECRAAAEKGNSREFHSVLNRQLTGLVADLFDQPQAGLTNDGIGEIMMNSGYPSELTDQLMDLLEICHLNSFAASPAGTAEMTGTMDRASALAGKLWEESGKRQALNGKAAAKPAARGSRTLGILLLAVMALSLLLPAAGRCDNGASGNRSLVYFEEGIGLYRDKKYQEAIEVWNKIPSDLGIANPSVFYNLGNAWYKLGEKGRARLYYEKALKLDPDMEDARYNLDYLIPQLEDKIEVPEPNFVEVLLRGWQSLFSLKSLTVLTIGFLHLLLLGLVLLFLVPAARRPAMLMMSFGLILSLVFGATLAMTAYDRDYRVVGIVISDTADVFSEPNLSSKLKFSLHEGARVTIEGVDGLWYRISLPNGYSGWAEKMSVDSI